eukprot:TRINITY_DN13229_c0_g1_i1.p1 TRINITY_DN13229_c0_g1~~TRINITY_DN13229_c0_g1_i1.p1  ORF type:complete len:335 (-),score=88.54 TRINITY_DN13229_c0_g1_i1:132-1076(-)
MTLIRPSSPPPSPSSSSSSPPPRKKLAVKKKGAAVRKAKAPKPRRVKLESRKVKKVNKLTPDARGRIRLKRKRLMNGIEEEKMISLRLTEGARILLEGIDEGGQNQFAEKVLDMARTIGENTSGVSRANFIHSGIQHMHQVEGGEIAAPEGMLPPGAKIEKDQYSCRKGCNHCCQQMVFVTDEEAQLLAMRLKDKYGDNIPEKVVSYMRKQAAYSSEHTAEFWALPKEESSCVFLAEDTGECTVYEDRPMVCRNFYVTSPPNDCSKEANAYIDRHVSTGGELWASAALNVANTRHEPFPQMVLESLNIPLFEEK